MTEKKAELAVQPKQDLTKMAPADLMQALANAAANPKVDPEKMERLMSMYERISEQQRQTAYMDAMARLQGKLPQIDRSGRIEVNQQTRSRYALLEDIDAAIRPLMAEEGFSASYNEESIDGNSRRYSCKLSHREGHSEMKYITLPLDSSGSKNSVQSAGSTFSYARRYLLQAHLNLVSKGEDTDGADVTPISEEELRDLETLMKDAGVQANKFMEWAGISKLEDMPKDKLNDAIYLLERRRKKTS